MELLKDLVKLYRHIPKSKKSKQEICLVKRFFDEQEKLPPFRRQKFCLISCPCTKCRPSHL